MTSEGQVFTIAKLHYINGVVYTWFPISRLARLFEVAGSDGIFDGIW
jgi:hypothetical protein